LKQYIKNYQNLFKKILMQKFLREQMIFLNSSVDLLKHLKK